MARMTTFDPLFSKFGLLSWILFSACSTCAGDSVAPSHTTPYAVLPLPQGAYPRCKFSPDGRTLVSYARKATCFWELTSRQERFRLDDVGAMYGTFEFPPIAVRSSCMTGLTSVVG
jgi:hypothetical protein